MKNVLFGFLLFFSHSLLAQNLPPVISNLQVELSGSNLLTLTFDLDDPEGDLVSVNFRAAAKGSLALDYSTSNATGDLGAGITPGAGKQIQWDYSAYASPMQEFRLQLVASDGQPVDIQSLVDQVDSVRLKNDLTFIQGIRHRSTGAVHLQEVKDFLQNHFTAQGLETYLHEFTYNGYQAQNIIGRHIGTENETTVYILDGHYDTVNDAPGADDNGSAVAGVMEALRILAPYSFKKSVKFIGFDLEEDGLKGSLQYIQNGILPGEDIAGVVNFEMIGYYTEQPNSQQTPTGFSFLFPAAYSQLQADQFRGNFITNVGIDISVPIMNAFSNAASTYVPGLKVISLEAPATWQVITPDLGRSDHAAFWVANIPAIMLTDGANFRNPNYHTPNDKLETINFTFMSNVVKAAVATIAELAEIQHATTWWTDTQLFSSTEEPDGCVFHVYPNPVHNTIRFNSGNCAAAGVTAQLLDLTGKIIRQEVFLQQSSGAIQSMEVEDLKPGIYFLRLKAGEKSWVQKLTAF